MLEAHCRGVKGCLKKVYYAENDGFFLCGCVCNLEKPNQKIHERQSIAEVQKQNKSNSSMDRRAHYIRGIDPMFRKAIR